MTSWSPFIRETLESDIELSSTARHLLDRLGHYANADGFAWPSVERLAHDMGRHPANVRRARAELVEAGIISITLGGGRGRANLYALNPRGTSSKPARQRAGKNHRSVHEDARTWCDETCAECAGAGWISDLRIVNGHEGWWAKPCPSRPS